MDEKKYSVIIETLKQMYRDKQIPIAKVKSMLNAASITLEEYDYILGKTQN